LKREERRAIIRSEEIMNRIYICGSFKFIREIDELKRRLEDENISVRRQVELRVEELWDA